jgi:hypothetical protein
LTHKPENILLVLNFTAFDHVAVSDFTVVHISRRIGLGPILGGAVRKLFLLIQIQGARQRGALVCWP